MGPKNGFTYNQWQFALFSVFPFSVPLFQFCFSFFIGGCRNGELAALNKASSTGELRSFRRKPLHEVELAPVRTCSNAKRSFAEKRSFSRSEATIRRSAKHEENGSVATCSFLRKLDERSEESSRRKLLFSKKTPQYHAQTSCRGTRQLV